MLALEEVKAGSFSMCAPNDGDNYEEGKVHAAVLTGDYFIGKTEVTQAQGKVVMGISRH